MKKRFAVFNTSNACLGDGPEFFVRSGAGSLALPACLGTFSTLAEADKCMAREAWPGGSLTLAKKGRRRLPWGAKGPNRWWAVWVERTPEEDYPEYPEDPEEEVNG